MMVPNIEHLVFSTRAAKPESGIDFNREIIAWSQGVSEEARRAFALRADLTGSFLSQRDFKPIFALARLATDAWLFQRAVSLGAYRKRSHQLLVHGLVLSQAHLDLLEGNPFLLDDEHVESTGFRFMDQHPDGQPELEPLRLDEHALPAVVQRRNQERFADLCQALSAAHDAEFPILYDAARQQESDRPTVILGDGRPDCRLVEWLLLHFHPHDRTELTFHTWYSYDGRFDYRLMLASEAEAPLLRQHFPGARRWPSPPSWPAAPQDGLGSRIGELRARGTRKFLATIEQYRLTFWGWRDKKPGPLEPNEIDLCLRYELDPDAVDEEEKKHVDELSIRGLNQLADHARTLADRFIDKADMADFEARRARIAARIGAVEQEDLRAARSWASGNRLERRYALLVLLRSMYEEDPEGRHELVRIWRELVPENELGRLLDLFTTPEEIDFAGPHLGPYIEAAARHEAWAQPARAEGEPDYWPEFLRRLASFGRLGAVSAKPIELIIEEASDSVLNVWAPLLQRICCDGGLPHFGFRVLFQTELPRLARSKDGRLASRVRAGIQELLTSEDRVGSLLAKALREEAIATEALAAMSEWLVRHDRERESALGRWSDLMGQQGQVLPPGVLDSAGLFLARLSISSFSPELPQILASLAGAFQPLPAAKNPRDEVLRHAALHLGLWAKRSQNAPLMADSLTALIKVRLEFPAGESVDKALLEILPEGLILPSHVSVPGLDTAFEALLDHWLELRLFPNLAADAREPWRRFARDEVSRRLEAPLKAEDPWYRAYLLLLWKSWAEKGRSAALRALLWRSGQRGISSSWQKEFLHAAQARGVMSREQLDGALQLITMTVTDMRPRAA